LVFCEWSPQSFEGDPSKKTKPKKGKTLFMKNFESLPIRRRTKPTGHKSKTKSPAH
jgi:hypothetical protein